MDAEIEGDIAFELSDSSVTVESDALSIDCGDEFRVSGDHGKLEIVKNQLFIVTFTGNVKLLYAGMAMEADRLKFGDGGPDEELQIDLNGNAQLAIVSDSESDEKWEMQADRIYYDAKTERVVLIGDGKFTRLVDGKPEAVTGEHVEFDSATQKAHVIKQ